MENLCSKSNANSSNLLKYQTKKEKSFVNETDKMLMM